MTSLRILYYAFVLLKMFNLLEVHVRTYVHDCIWRVFCDLDETSVLLTPDSTPTKSACSDSNLCCENDGEVCHVKKMTQTDHLSGGNK